MQINNKQDLWHDCLNEGVGFYFIGQLLSLLLKLWEGSRLKVVYLYGWVSDCQGLNERTNGAN